MPVAYGSDPTDAWQPIASLVLEAAYEATLLAADKNRPKTCNNWVFLTLLGGGAFRNRAKWIVEAALRALRLVRDDDLDVSIVSYGQPNTSAHALPRQWAALAD